MNLQGMSAETLELPHGANHARRTQGMRVVVQYQVNFDGWIVRFDTIFDGNQYNIAYRIPEEATDEDLQKKADALIPLALKAWVDNAWARGRMIWLANDPRL